MIHTSGVVLLRESPSGIEVLLTRHKSGLLRVNGSIGIPGGQPGPGETPRVTAARELSEETGMYASLNDLVFLPRVYHADIVGEDGTKETFSLLSFLARRYEGTLAESDEEEPFWLSVDKLSAQEQLLPNVQRVILDAIEYRKMNNLY